MHSHPSTFDPSSDNNEKFSLDDINQAIKAKENKEATPEFEKIFLITPTGKCLYFKPEDSYKQVSGTRFDETFNVYLKEVRACGTK
jgi:hypothetical protein